MTADAPGADIPDPARLQAWLSARVPGFRGPIKLEKFAGGQSNPTFRLIASSGDYVLRRKPAGPVLPSAHMVDREFRVLAALAATDVPVPQVHALCLDDGVIGSAFYVMEFLSGRVFFDPRLPGLAPAERGGIFAAMGDSIARLHAVDPASIGLADFGRPEGYMQRQMARWSKQYRAAETARIPAMDRLIDWLPARLPTAGASRIVHGDLRLDNMLIHPSEPRVIAVLDWELSTLGDPLSDLANNALAWRLEPELFRGLAGVVPPVAGVPTEAAYLDAYFRRTGGRVPEDWDIYIIFNLFRLAAIMQGIARRALDGTASDPAAEALGRAAAPIADKAWRLADARGGQ